MTRSETAVPPHPRHVGDPGNMSGTQSGPMQADRLRLLAVIMIALIVVAAMAVAVWIDGQAAPADNQIYDPVPTSNAADIP